MKAYLTRRYILSASHRLNADSLSDEQNKATYGKCNNPHGHGHNYSMEVTVSGQVSAETGMVCNLVELDEAVRHTVLDRFDHQNLNTLEDFAALVPTTENLTEVIYNILKQSFHSAHLEKVRIEETSKNSFEYAGGAELRH
ncbi:MAG TPA: 6-carboxytetrahydropterin synthase [Terriglobales bacterium]